MVGQDKIVRSLVDYFKTDQWEVLMNQLTQIDEELYHTHVYLQSNLDPYSICKLLAGYFERKQIPLDRKIDVLGTRPGRLAAHSVHPHDPERAVVMPAIDFFWNFNSDVVLEPSDPEKLGEEGTNIITWGKNFLDNHYKQHEFKCVGPREEREIRKYFQSSHWKKGLRLVEDPAYEHVHINVEINFDPWILKVFAVEYLKEIGWKIDLAFPCVFHSPRGYIAKIIFLAAYPEEVFDIAWWYSPDVVIRPATFEFAKHPPEGEIAYDVVTKQTRETTMSEADFQVLTDDQIEEVLNQVI